MSSYTELAQAFGADSSDELSLWPHLVRRIAVLVGDDDIRYAESTRNSVEGGKVRGSAVVLTETRVVYAQFSKTPNDADAENPDDSSSTMEVSCWSRRTLLSLDLNSKSGQWVADQEGSHGSDDWPLSGRLVLRFQGRNKPLRLPLNNEGDAPASIGVLLSGLLRDLDASR